MASFLILDMKSNIRGAVTHPSCNWQDLKDANHKKLDADWISFLPSTENIIKSSIAFSPSTHCHASYYFRQTKSTLIIIIVIWYFYHGDVQKRALEFVLPYIEFLLEQPTWTCQSSPRLNHSSFSLVSVKIVIVVIVDPFMGSIDSRTWRYLSYSTCTSSFDQLKSRIFFPHLIRWRESLPYSHQVNWPLCEG